MRKTIFFLLGLLLAFPGLNQAQDLRARIKVDIERTIGEVDPLIYGQFTEHLGRCIYGGIYDPNSTQADADGFRKDVLQATRDMGATIVRWPGGNFVSGYHWTDGIGPKDQRPMRKDLAWNDFEPNQVGTDEFLHWSQLAGVEPYICVNMGTGSLEEARSWVEYCNGRDVYWAKLREQNGHPDPYKVTFWGLGNEIDGDWQMGHKNAEDYGKFALEAAKLMKWVDNDIKLIASGSSDYGQGKWLHWNRTVLDYLYNYIDYLSLHYYIGGWGLPPDWSRDPRYFLARILEVEEKIEITQGLINEVRTARNLQRPIYIALDEYNVWYRAFNEKKLEEHYDFQDALMIAQYFNCILRHADIVKMANMAQLVNVIAPLFVEGDQVWRQTTFYPFQLFAQHCRGTAVDAFVDAPNYDVRQFRSVPYLDVSAVYDASGKELVLNVVNRHPESAIRTDVISQFGRFQGKAEVFELYHKDLYAENSRTEQKVQTTRKELAVSGDSFGYTFPAHSFTMFKIKLQ